MAGCIDYQDCIALGDRDHHSRGGCALRIGKLSVDPLGLRTDLMWDRLMLLATLGDSTPGTSAWEDRTIPPLSARHPGEEEEFDEEEIDDEDEDLDDEFDDEEDLDEDFDDEEDIDDIDDEIDEDIDDIDLDEEDEDLDEEDEDLDEDEEDEELDDL